MYKPLTGVPTRKPPEVIPLPPDFSGRYVVMPVLDGAVRVWDGDHVVYDCPEHLYRPDYHAGIARYVRTRPARCMEDC